MVDHLLILAFCEWKYLARGIIFDQEKLAASLSLLLVFFIMILCSGHQSVNFQIFEKVVVVCFLLILFLIVLAFILLLLNRPVLILQLFKLSLRLIFLQLFLFFFDLKLCYA